MGHWAFLTYVVGLGHSAMGLHFLYKVWACLSFYGEAVFLDIVSKVISVFLAWAWASWIGNGLL
jgi:hypothetical protein